MCTVLSAAEAATAIAQEIDPLGTPDSWKAWLLPTTDNKQAKNATHLARRRMGEPLMTAASASIVKENPKAVRVANTAVFFPPPLKEQLISQEGTYTKDGGYLEYGGRIYATMNMTIPPTKAVRSSALVAALSGMKTRGSDGTPQRVPYRITMRLRGNGMKLVSWSSGFALLIKSFSVRNAKLWRAHKALTQESHQDQSIASVSITLTTWADSSSPTAIQQIKQRVVALRSAATQWGGMQVVEDTIDRAEAFLTSIPGLSLKPGPVEGVGTLNDLLPLFPWGRPASPLGNSGTELYRSNDGAVMPTESHSSKQDYWLETMTAPMGGGKSAQANRKHFDYVFAPGRETLPFLHIMDIGGSVSGMVELLQDVFPEDKKHLAYMHTLRNSRDNAVNMLDPKLGLRYPLDGDLDATVDWLTALVTPAERSEPYENMSEFCKTILLATYKRFDDGRDQAQPRLFKPGTPEIDKALAELRIDIKQGTPWYAVADMLGIKGKYQAAIRAHRKAVPLLSDLHSVANDDNIRGDYMASKTQLGTPIPEAFVVQLGLARDSYPIFTEETCFDLRGRRITAIDLAEVTPQGSPSARKQASIMYQVGYELFQRNIRITQNDLLSIPEPWQPYYQNLLQELSNTDKHIAIDEYHRTMIQAVGDESKGKSVDHDSQGLRATLIREGGRESRKWALSICTISQEARDHGRLFQMASISHILKRGGTDETAYQTSALSLSRTDNVAMYHFVNGPRKGEGVTFLSRWITKDGPFNQLFTSTIGPKMLWSLSTTFEDKTIRKLVFDALGRSAGRAALAKYYPGGTAKDEVERRKRSKSEDLNDSAAVVGACQEIANELISNFRANPIFTN
jgi:intracellular multiplication protein IcmB